MPGSKTNTQAKASRFRKRWLVLGLVALFAAALALLALDGVRGWLLDWAVQAAVRASDGRLTVENVQRFDGPMTTAYAPEGLTIGRLRWTQPDGTQMDADDVRVRVRWTRLLQRELSLYELRARRVALKIVLGDKPVVLPPRLELPGQLRIDDVAIDTLSTTVGLGKAFDIRGVRFGLDYRDHKYTVSKLALTHESGTVEGRLQAADAEPYAIEADTRVFVKLPTWTDPVLADLQWRGDARAIAVQGNANLRETRVDLASRLMPLAQQKIAPIDWSVSDFRSNRFFESPVPLRLRMNGTIEPKMPLRTTLSATNLEPGRFDAQKLPLEQANARIELLDERLRIDALQVQLMGQGEASGSAQIGLAATPDLLQRVRLDLQLRRIKPDALYGGLASADLSGRVRVDARGVDFDLRESGALLDGGMAANGLVTFNRDRVLIERSQISARSGVLSAAGTIALAAPNAFELKGEARRFELQRWFNVRPIAGREPLEGLISGSYLASGAIKPKPEALLDVRLRDSRLAGLPLAGTARARLHGETRSVDELDVKLALGASRISAAGGYGRPEDRLDLRLESDALNQLDARLAGKIDLRSQVRGGEKSPLFALQWNGSGLQVQAGDAKQPPVRVAAMRGNAEFALEPNSPLEVQLNASGVRAGELNLDQLAASTRGMLSAHQFTLSGSGAGQRLRASGSGELDLVADDANGAAWRARIDRLDSDGRVSFAISQPMKLAIAPQSYAIEGLDARVFSGRLRVEQAAFGAGAGAPQGRGEFNGIMIDELLGGLARLGLIAPPPTSANPIKIKADGRFDLSGTGKEDLNGSFSFDARSQPVDGRSSGDLKFNAGALSGQLRVQLPSLAWARQFVGDEWQVDGMFDFDGEVAGRLSAPKLNGAITGRGLRLEQRLLGWRFAGGTLNGKFDGDRLRIEQLRLPSDSGYLDLSGQLQLPTEVLAGNRQAGVTLGNGDFTLRASRLPLSFGPGQRFALSGDTQITVDRNRLNWTGTLVADEGLIELKDLDAAAAPSDLVIVDKRDNREARIVSVPAAAPQPGAAPRATAAAGRGAAGGADMVQVNADLKLDLGKKFRVVGGGVDARLTGVVGLGGSLPGTPTANGIVQVVDGKYRAYGQELVIERGRLIFNGRLDNPTLDIVAMRKYLPVEAGVALGGTAQAPRTRLVSVPEVPDADKLSWLVLGVSLEDAGGSASSAALQTAAIALFSNEDGTSASGNIASALGLDVLGVRGASSTSGFSGMQGGVTDARIPGQIGASTTAGSASQNVVTVGKRLSSRLFVSYEQGLRGVWNLLKIQYDISNRFSLRALTGSESAIDLLYFFSFD